MAGRQTIMLDILVARIEERIMRNTVDLIGVRKNGLYGFHGRSWSPAQIVF